MSRLADSTSQAALAAQGRVWARLGVFELAHLDSANRVQLRRDPRVVAVEPPEPLMVLDQQSLSYSSLWGLDVLDQRSLTPNNLFNYYYTGGNGVHIYIVDSGIDCGHDEFASGVNCFGAAFLADGNWPGPWADAVGHGTRMASLAAGQTTGIARTATLHSVKVLNALTGNDEGNFIDGLEWVLANAPAGAVVNISIAPVDGTLSSAFRTAVSNLVSANISAVLAAGNGGADTVGDNVATLNSCDLHSMTLVVSAAASDGSRPPFANFGSCVDLFSPGAGLRAALTGTTSSYTDVSGGTSSATAVVSGIVATILQQNYSLGVGDIETQLKAAGTAGILQSTTLGTGSPNLLVNSLNLYYKQVVGPTQVVTTNPQSVTWSVNPIGGSGSYTYVWSASVNGGAWTQVATTQSYTRSIPRFAEYNLLLKVAVSSAGETYLAPYAHLVSVTCGGC